jgi:hypothetical protein
MKNLLNGTAAKVIAIIAAALLFIWGASYFTNKNPEQVVEIATTTAKTGTIGAQLKSATTKKTTPTTQTKTSTAAPDPKETTATSPVIGMDLNMVEKQSVQLAGTNITLTIEFVQDMTSAGCVGSPSSCVDKVDISMKKDFDYEVGTLYSPATIGVVAQNKNQATLFGYKVTLLSMKQKSVILRVETAK